MSFGGIPLVLLLGLHRHLRDQEELFLREQGYSELTARHLALLNGLLDGPLPLNELASWFGLSKRATWPYLRQLVSWQLITFDDHPFFRVTGLIHLTHQGTHLLSTFQTYQLSQESQLIQIVGPEQYGYIRDILNHLAVSLDEAREKDSFLHI